MLVLRGLSNTWNVLVCVHLWMISRTKIVCPVHLISFEQNSWLDTFLKRQVIKYQLWLPTWPRLETHRSLIGQTFPAGPRRCPISRQSAKPSSDPHSWTPITLHTWIGSRWPRHTQRAEAECLRLWNGLCNSCDGQRRPRPPLVPAPGPGVDMSFTLERWRRRRLLCNN